METAVVYLMHYRDIHIGMLGNTSKKFRKGSRRLGQDLNLGTPEYKTGMGLLLTRYAQQKFHLVMLHNPAEETFVSQEECLITIRDDDDDDGDDDCTVIMMMYLATYVGYSY
jgi:hypothetical protein